MKHFSLALLLFIAAITFADDAPVYTVKRTDDPTVEVVDLPTPGALKKNWVFIVDTSDSMEGVFHKALKGWNHVTQAPTDDWSFCVYVFNNSGHDKHTKWLVASPANFERVKKWVKQPSQRGVNSNGRLSIEKALRLTRSELSIILITDGGFTTACENRGFGKIRQTIIDGQAWRKENKLNQATITTIGISNSHYSNWCLKCVRGPRTTAPHNYALPDAWRSNKGKKPTNADCQAFLREIGTAYDGGYILVRHNEPPVKKQKKAIQVQPTPMPEEKR